jgi:hypothetical protein
MFRTLHIALVAGLFLATACTLPVLARCPQDDGPDTGEPLNIGVSGAIRDGRGRPVEGATVELIVNPYCPTSLSTRTSATTDAAGLYSVAGQGHKGVVRVRAHKDGYRTGLREVRGVRHSRDFVMNFSLHKK